MKKIRLVRTMVVEYEPDLEVYPNDWTIEEMAQCDANADDRELTFDVVQLDNVAWEVVEDGVVINKGVADNSK